MSKKVDVQKYNFGKLLSMSPKGVKQNRRFRFRE
jgi:hypothetical protein